jgi:hypothetical protein
MKTGKTPTLKPWGALHRVCSKLVGDGVLGEDEDDFRGDRRTDPAL